MPSGKAPPVASVSRRQSCYDRGCFGWPWKMGTKTLMLGGSLGSVGCSVYNHRLEYRLNSHFFVCGGRFFRRRFGSLGLPVGMLLSALAFAAKHCSKS